MNPFWSTLAPELELSANLAENSMRPIADSACRATLSLRKEKAYVWYRLYRRALARFAISLIFTIADGLICPIALYNTFGNGVMFALVLLVMIPWVWTLVNIWQYTFSDLRRVQDTVSVHEYDEGLATVDRDA